MTASTATTRANPSSRSAEAGTNSAGARDELGAIEGLLVWENATTRERRRALEEVGRASAKRADGVDHRAAGRRRGGVENGKDDDDDDGCASSSVDPFSPSAKGADAGRRRPGETTLGRDLRDGSTTTTPATTRANAEAGVAATTPNDAVFALESAFDKVRISPTNPFEFGSAKDEEDEASPSPSASRRDEPELELEENLTPKSRQLSADFDRCDAVEEKTPDAKDGVRLHLTSAPGAPFRRRNRRAAGSADFVALDVRSDPVDVESIVPRRLFDADE